MNWKTVPPFWHLERFWQKVEPNPSGCWLWKGCLSRGYGQVQIDSKQMASHRFAWEDIMGPVPEGLWVLHKCDVRNCVNPQHLFLGTNSDNVKDAVSKG